MLYNIPRIQIMSIPKYFFQCNLEISLTVCKNNFLKLKAFFSYGTLSSLMLKLIIYVYATY